VDGQATRPRLKDVSWERAGDELRLVYEWREQLLLADPDGSVAMLLELLRAGGRTTAELAAALSGGRPEPVPVADVQAAIALLDSYRLVEDERRLGGLTAAAAERHFSTVGFFESFGTLERSREDLCRELAERHVLVLGTGGLNSNTLPHLCGLGVGRVTLLDRDAVEPRNFARQYLYRWTDIGSRKVERAAAWVRAFDPAIEVAALDTGIESTEQLGDLLDLLRPDVVAAGIDQPGDVDRWVNAACVPRGIPFVRGGMWVTDGAVWSVDPGRSACFECSFRAVADAEVGDELAEVRAGLALAATRPRTNRGIGPIAGLLGAYGAFELLRYLTRFEPPVYAANPLFIDFAGGCATRQRDWPRDPDCPVCAHLHPTGPQPAGRQPAAADTGDRLTAASTVGRR